MYRLRWYCRAFTRYGASNKCGVGKTSYFRAKCDHSADSADCCCITSNKSLTCLQLVSTSNWIGAIFGMLSRRAVALLHFCNWGGSRGGVGCDRGDTKSFNPLTPIVAIWVNPVPEWVKPSCVIFDMWALCRLNLAERPSARMSKITNDGLTRSSTGSFIDVFMGIKGLLAVATASKGFGTAGTTGRSIGCR